MSSSTISKAMKQAKPINDMFPSLTNGLTESISEVQVSLSVSRMVRVHANSGASFVELLRVLLIC